LEKYVEDADVGREALRQLGLLSSAGADSAVLLAKIAEGMRSADSLQRRAVQDVLGFHRFEPMRPVLEAALEDEDPSVRLTAARILVNHPDSRALLAHATDAEPEVRKLVAKLLRDLGQSNWREEEPDALARLLAVEDDGIRGQAWEILIRLPSEERVTTLPAEEVFDGDRRERTRRLYVAPLPDSV